MTSLRGLGARRLELTRRRFARASAELGALINVYTPLTNALRRQANDPSYSGGIAHVRKYASDLRKSIAFYTESAAGCATMLRRRWPHSCDAFLRH